MTTPDSTSTQPAQPAAGAPILPEHPGYDQARMAWNLAADQRPAAIVIADTADQVIGAVEFARRRGLKVAPQGTGHLAAALPDLRDAVLVKTAIEGAVEVDADARRARVPAGAVAQQLVDAAVPHGLAALSGSSHDVGVVGYMLGGGVSWLARSQGLACNHVHAIELVTADGRLVRTDRGNEPELFWALRGGGGNFGIVTHIEVELLPITSVFAGMTVWAAEHARPVLEAWLRWTRGAPESATTSARLLRLPPLPEIPDPLRDTPVVVIDGAVLAASDEAERILSPIREAAPATIDSWDTVPPPALLQIHMDPPGPVPGAGHHALLDDIGDAGLDALLGVVDPDVVSPLLFAELRHLGGALGRPPTDGGARSSLEGSFALFGVGMVMSPDDAGALETRLDALVGAMSPWSTGTVYAGFAERGGSAAAAYSGSTYERLSTIRRTWDPEELFVGAHRIATS